MNWTLTPLGELLLGGTLVGVSTGPVDLPPGDYTIGPVDDHTAPLVLSPGGHTMGPEASIDLPRQVIDRVIASRISVLTVTAPPAAEVLADPAPEDLAALPTE